MPDERARKERRRCGIFAHGTGKKGNQVLPLSLCAFVSCYCRARARSYRAEMQMRGSPRQTCVYALSLSPCVSRYYWLAWLPSIIYLAPRNGRNAERSLPPGYIALPYATTTTTRSTLARRWPVIRPRERMIRGRLPGELVGNDGSGGSCAVSEGFFNARVWL